MFIFVLTGFLSYLTSRIDLAGGRVEKLVTRILRTGMAEAKRPDEFRSLGHGYGPEGIVLKIGYDNHRAED